VKRSVRSCGFGIVLHAALLALFAAVWSGAALAASITGVVTNKTTGKPAAGDDVTLIKLAQGMQEAGQTKTDARGHFTLEAPDDGVHLVRVTHDKANYFEPVVDPAQPVNIEVYTAAAKVEGVTSEAEVLRVQTDPGGNGLSVVANFFVKNVSSPPKTQFSDRPFEVYLPAGAVIEGSMALGPGKMAMPVKSAPVPLGDAPDHYAFLFPLRPCASKTEAAQDANCGETRFQVTFQLPYSGSLGFAPKVAMPTDTVAVMLPKSMTFKPGAGASYVPATDELNAQAFVARNVQPGEPLGFTVSGSGQLPRDTPATGGESAGAEAVRRGVGT
jgi:5-hydroxyisourate hydrolase-like protein (transthyretin family)